MVWDFLAFHNHNCFTTGFFTANCPKNCSSWDTITQRKPNKTGLYRAVAFHHDETFFDIRHFHWPGAVVGSDDVQIPHLCLENKHVGRQVYFYNHWFDPENFLDPHLVSWYTSPMASMWHKPCHFHPIWPLDAVHNSGNCSWHLYLLPTKPLPWVLAQPEQTSNVSVSSGPWYLMVSRIIPFYPRGPENDQYDLSWEERNPTSYRRISNMD